MKIWIYTKDKCENAKSDGCRGLRIKDETHCKQCIIEGSQADDYGVHHE